MVQVSEETLEKGREVDIGMNPSGHRLTLRKQGSQFEIHNVHTGRQQDTAATFTGIIQKARDLSDSSIHTS